MEHCSISNHNWLPFKHARARARFSNRSRRISTRRVVKIAPAARDLRSAHWGWRRSRDSRLETRDATRGVSPHAARNEILYDHASWLVHVWSRTLDDHAHWIVHLDDHPSWLIMRLSALTMEDHTSQIMHHGSCTLDYHTYCAVHIGSYILDDHAYWSADLGSCTFMHPDHAYWMSMYLVPYILDDYAYWGVHLG